MIDTQREAYEAAQAFAPTAQAVVLATLRECGALTCSEIAAASGLSVLTVRPTVTIMVQAGTLTRLELRRRNTNGRREAVVSLP